MRKKLYIAITALALVCVCFPLQPQASRPAPPSETRIDINQASVEELMKVPGMKRSWAGRIVRFRPYWSKTDLIDRGVIPGEVYERFKDYVIARRNNYKAKRAPASPPFFDD